MQVDAKFLLEDVGDLERVTKALQGGFLYEERYKDYFFDFPSHLLAQRAAVLRLRVPTETGEMNAHNLSSLTLKDHSMVERGEQVFGVQQVKRLQQEMVEVVLRDGDDLLSVLKRLCRDAVQDPESPLASIITELETLAVSAEVPPQVQLVGSYTTHRKVYKYDSPSSNAGKAVAAGGSGFSAQPSPQVMHIRIDETEYPFGKKYELELPRISVPLHDVMIELQEYLRSLGVKYSLSLESKYARFMKYTRGLTQAREDVQGVKLRLYSIDSYMEVLAWMQRMIRDAASEEPPSSHMSQASHYSKSQSQRWAGDALLQRGASDVEAIAHGTQELASQALRQYSQRSVPVEAEYISQKVARDTESKEEVDEERYQENYYFDDATDGTLLKRRCFVRLRCIDDGAAFILELKEDERMMVGTQNSSSLRAELSGDVARILLRDPTQFLVSQREHNHIAEILWREYGLERLKVVAFFVTRRRIFRRCANAAFLRSWQKQQQQIQEERRVLLGEDGYGAAMRQLSPPPSSQSTAAQVVPSMCINVDRTRYDLSHPAEYFAKAAADSPACSYSSVAAVPPATHVKELFEMEATKIAAGGQQAVKEWLRGELNRLCIEWRFSTQNKVDQYFSYVDAPLLQTQQHRSQSVGIAGKKD
ncbi:hypothetical protein DQ04_01791060 [Trypanosoma grayi]|uniref:hypothetical protein n=1 Tax=Trypanosoma grayi TaxID=71804 RepID=UPI0004F47540|nr:hypothetical protein DQ04_01791060 [Trypanosoma grayi]KEG12334.1 hypothetical protein DQ04_01791060 [Trypanosoma grayi]